jgi:Mg-chelatase subunit ChlD
MSERRSCSSEWRSTRVDPTPVLLALTALVVAVMMGCESASPEAAAPSSTRPTTVDASACQPPDGNTVGALDVAIAVDTSRSTADPSGIDVNANGLVGERVASRWTDPGDSLLAAQIAGITSLVREARGLDVRFSIVSFSGSYTPAPRRSPMYIVSRSEAKIRSGLTGDTEALEGTLQQLLASGSNGQTSFRAGMQRSVQALSTESPSPRDARRKVLLISDSSTPIRLEKNEALRRLDHSMKRVASWAIAAGIPIDTFAIGPAARVAPPHTLSRIAGATGGRFRAVTDPKLLACHLIASLAP